MKLYQIITGEINLIMAKWQIVSAQIEAEIAEPPTLEAILEAYKEISLEIKELSKIKEKLFNEAEIVFVDYGHEHYQCVYGSAGYTVPKTPKLDKARWEQLCKSDVAMYHLQQEFDEAKEELEAAQSATGCFVLPEPTFYIR